MRSYIITSDGSPEPAGGRAGEGRAVAAGAAHMCPLNTFKYDTLIYTQKEGDKELSHYMSCNSH